MVIPERIIIRLHIDRSLIVSVIQIYLNAKYPPWAKPGWIEGMHLLRDIVRRVTHPVIANRRDLATYVIVTTLVCLVVALSADVINQLVFFAGWPAAFRSWAITSTVVPLIAAPVSWSIGRTHLELHIAKLMVSQHLAALERAHEATEAAHQLAQSLAKHDALTGLPNRRVFAEALENAVARASRGSSTYAILSIDLDRFKPVNDVHGHAAGDAVLCEIASRLREVVRKSDTVARFGGDEFGVIFEFGSSDESETAAHLAKRIIDRIQEPIDVSEKRVEVGASIGIALCPADGSDSEALLRAADLAMYRAKRDGRGGYCFFQQSMEINLLARAALEEDVRQAVANEEIRPHYQPLVKLAENRLAGFEILPRWHHPTRGEVEPAIFIPVVEKLGLIGQLIYSLLRRACLDGRHWQPEITIALNVSPMHFRDPLLPVKFLAILSETDFPPARLEVEVTEAALISDLPAARAALRSLQDIGVKISLDDFGAGYSNLHHLRELRFDRIKIARSLVTSMAADPERAKIVLSVLALAKSLGMPTIAEGIEHLQTIRELTQGRAEFGLGFYFGKAVRADAADKLVQDATRGVAPRSAT